MAKAIEGTIMKTGPGGMAIPRVELGHGAFIDPNEQDLKNIGVVQEIIGYGLVVAHLYLHERHRLDMLIVRGADNDRGFNPFTHIFEARDVATIFNDFAQGKIYNNS